MGIRAVSEMTQDELNALRGKKSFVKPLFETDDKSVIEKKEPVEEGVKHKRRRKKEVEEVEHVEEKPKCERKRKKDKNIEQVNDKPKRERKSKKEVSTKEIIAKPEKNNKSTDQMNKEMEAALLQHKSKKQIREEKRRKKQKEAELYPNEIKKERRLKREKFEKEATDKLEKELRQTPKSSKSNNGKLVFTTLYDNEAHDRLIQIYSQVTAKRTKAEQELDKIKKGCRNKTGLLIALHEDNAGGERFSMMGKLVEMGFASHCCYSTGYHLYEILE